MKKFINILILVCLGVVVNEVYAQRYLPGQQGIQITAGMADGLHWNDNTNFAYYFGVSVATYTKNANRWVVGAEYFHKKYQYREISIPLEQYTAEAGYYLKFLADRKKVFFLSLGLSGMLGYESSNRGEKLLYDGATLLNKDAFIYGGAATLEMELFLCDRIVFLMNVRERLLFGSSIGKFHTQFGIGFKLIIN
ncbi:conjugal transfer protein TraO [Bacteroidales bacterium OttesenSCG-928-K03]|nr:conjugal transfer protein TraO [Odoribacter sp. OttesenSCG-928-L07]MDL2239169.1 conjugal transfer protein TraO [Bacteroidales bacterium OttesenSCG-928-L14]MDL2240170.1 conjugal transfer protein TraO [Bacteroidales bacterium OttesenSCG-928-K22]MDL2242475.1 conjugal transfer protein TraO [Bacteroidales bacterium OttesenSCG-928-K03]